MERTKIIEKILTDFEQNNLQYVVLRNYDFLLEDRKTLYPSEKSIDLCVSRQSFFQLREYFLSHGFQQRSPQFSLQHQAFFKVLGKEIISFDVQIGGVHWNDMCYLDEKYLLKNRVKKFFFYVPDDNDTLVMLVVHSILGKRYFKQEYQQIISLLEPTTDKNYVYARFRNIFDHSTALELILLVQQQRFNMMIHKKNKYLFTFLFQQRRLFTFIPLFFRWLEWKKFLQPYPLISIIGPDGAGKSTHTTALATFLKEHHRKIAVIYTGRGRGNLLPFASLGRRYKRQEKRLDVDTQKSPHLWKRKLLYSFAAPMFAADLLLRYLVHILPMRRQRTIVLTDRYCSDIMLMNHVPFWIKRSLLWFFPKPTITFYLYNTPEILHQRRPEEAIAELQRQLALFVKLQKVLHPKAIITKNKESTQQQIRKEVIRYLYQNWY